ncbi:hypothetical protein J1N35_029784 [Gossypium stocksii]|uniref:RNase H type-1 domain-containing protein n=1 Tax=Gossypium stocksii TaxID=47602 RepID=A0A9D3UZD8_9ROSI|nr:hypothetical protein J1N35_029784 [Gossypium stocksii]
MDEDQLRIEAVNFYKSLYGEYPSQSSVLPTSAFSILTNEDFNLLNILVSNEEIKAALFDMAALRAPGMVDSQYTCCHQGWQMVPYSTGSQWPSTFPPFFTDNLILFGYAKEQQAQVIKNILDNFCNYSGHKINTRKTNIFFSKGVDDSLRKWISSLFGFQEVNNLGDYLGVPLFTKGLRIMLFVSWLTRYLGNCSVLEAKLLGILDGLKIILDRSFKRVLIQTDNIEAINVIQESSTGSSNSALVRRILLILKTFEKWRIQHIFHEENLVADRLAKSVHSKRLGLRLIEDPLVRI